MPNRTSRAGSERFIVEGMATRLGNTFTAANLARPFHEEIRTP